MKDDTFSLQKRAARIIIAIDPGTTTGLAVFDKFSRKLVKVKSSSILPAIREVLFTYRAHAPGTCFILIEDARKRTWFGEKGREALQGAGSIKRDCTIWEEALNEAGVNYEMVPPKKNKTKINATRFKLLTGWEGSTNEHSRDAGMLAFLP